MKQKVYLETSVISYLTAIAKTPVVKHRQLQAQLLWDSDLFTPIVSEIVLDEIGRGNERQAQKRIALITDLEVLVATDEAVYLAKLLVARKALPNKAYVDALHIAITTAHSIPVIASYNFRHIAGAFSRRLIEQTLVQLGYIAPVIANPEELIGV